MTSSNNVIDLVAFKNHKLELTNSKAQKGGRVDIDPGVFVDNYFDTAIDGGALIIHDEVLKLLRVHGYEVSEFNSSDIKLLREVVISCIMRYKQHDHPLQSFAVDFDKYFSEIEEFYMDDID